MVELIGIEHVSKKLADAVLDHLSMGYPNLSSVMLELDSPMKDHISFNHFGYFEHKLLENNVKIIYGDGLFKERSGAYLACEYDIISEDKLNETRELANAKMYDIMQKTNTELVILGASHTAYIKNRDPSLHHSFFSEGEIFRWNIKEKELRIEKERVLSSVDELFTVGFTLIDARNCQQKYPSIKHVTRV